MSFRDKINKLSDNELLQRGFSKMDIELFRSGLKSLIDAMIDMIEYEEEYNEVVRASDVLSAMGDEGKLGIVNGGLLITEARTGGSMIKSSVTIEEVLEVLNRAVEVDPEAMHSLCTNRVPCNNTLAKDPTIQVSKTLREGANYKVGLLGILNGIFGTDESGWGTIAGEFEVVCPSCKTQGEKGTSEGDLCPVCQTPLTSGKLLKFVDLNRRT